MKDCNVIEEKEEILLGTYVKYERKGEVVGGHESKYFSINKYAY